MNDSLQSYYDNDAMHDLLIDAVGDEFNHIGIYDDPNDLRSGGLRATEEALQGIVLNLEDRVADLGSGYGGTARYIVGRSPCHVDCLNISKMQNDINRKKNQDLKIDNLIKVFEGDFAHLPFEDNQYDVVIAQESMTQAADKQKVTAEVARILKKNGVFVLVDAMWRDNSKEVKDFIANNFWGYEQIASIKDYYDLAEKAGMRLIRFADHSPNLVIGYADDVQVCEKRLAQAQTERDKEIISHELTVFKSRYQASKNGYLCLGFFQFRKS